MEKSELVDSVIRNSDIVLIVLDARMIKDSMNKYIEDKIKRYRKKYLYVINKIDLISKEEQNKIDLENSVQISARLHINTLTLFRKIKEISKGKEVTVSVVGFPNTGKSAVINALKGRRSAPISPVSGYTKNLQRVRIDKNLLMVDTPGVFNYSNKKEIVLLGVINVENLENPEYTATELIQSLNGQIEKYFDVEIKKDHFETLEEIAIKKHILKKGGLPDTKRMAVDIIRMCQKGKIKIN
ncbi:MAG: 50S ribosome-binding GTPase [Candidatus Nanoarchaeia archaeon]|nr:50S ribosome-binding GTPase [Candidatus Nanoarchaeia archaeon]